MKNKDILISFVIFGITLLILVSSYISSSGNILALSLNSAPILDSVSPNEVYNYQSTKITISGTEFFMITETISILPQVILGNTPLIDIEISDNTTLIATIPSDLPSGIYSLTVVNPDGQSASLNQALTIMQAGDGAITEWEIISSMRTPRENLAVATWQKYLYALGGKNHYYNPPCNTVEFTTVSADGNLADWQLTTPMNQAHDRPPVIAHKGFLYVLGSTCEATSCLDVEYTSINTDGTLGSWQYTTPLIHPRDAEGGSAVVVDDYIYILGGASSTSVDRAFINADGTLGNWDTVGYTLKRRYGVSAIAIGRFIYAIGGQGESTVEKAEVRQDGSLGPWQFVSEMNYHRGTFGVVTLGGYIYVIAGWGGPEGGSISPIKTVERATLYQDGSLGPWELVPSLTDRKRHIAAAEVGGTLYAIGGGLDSSTFAEIEAARFSPPTINSISPTSIAAIKPTTIIFKGNNFLPFPTLQLNSTHISSTFISTTSITAIVPSGLATKNYTVTLTNPNGLTVCISNALRVDEVAPEANYVSINDGALHTTSRVVSITVAATDLTDNYNDLSMSLSNEDLVWSSWQPYTKITNWMLTNADGIKKVYVRFRDLATNESEIISDTIELNTSVSNDYGLSINNGELYTNILSVTLGIGAKSGTAQMQISNDGGFVGAIWEPYISYKIWQITQYGNYVIPRVVYIRYKNTDGNTSATYQDDIILDINAPTGSVNIGFPSRAKHELNTINAISVTLYLTAEDDVSGVADMIISNRSDFTGASWESYATTKTWSGAERTMVSVYVRFRDRAGNISTTYSDTFGKTYLYLPLVVHM